VGDRVGVNLSDDSDRGSSKSADVADVADVAVTTAEAMMMISFVMDVDIINKWDGGECLHFNDYLLLVTMILFTSGNVGSDKIDLGYSKNHNMLHTI